MYKNKYIIQPFKTGKDYRSLSIVIPSQIVKEFNIDPAKFLLLDTETKEDITIRVLNKDVLFK
jgi:hypothetical protein